MFFISKRKEHKKTSPITLTTTVQREDEQTALDRDGIIAVQSLANAKLLANETELTRLQAQTEQFKALQRIETALVINGTTLVEINKTLGNILEQLTQTAKIYNSSEALLKAETNRHIM